VLSWEDHKAPAVEPDVVNPFQDGNARSFRMRESPSTSLVEGNKGIRELWASAATQFTFKHPSDLRRLDWHMRWLFPFSFLAFHIYMYGTISSYHSDDSE
ncbi:hypothetical protein CYMTET_35883, partial [Cymbomonas tetramitiformis]